MFTAGMDAYQSIPHSVEVASACDQIKLGLLECLVEVELPVCAYTRTIYTTVKSECLRLLRHTAV